MIPIHNFQPRDDFPSSAGLGLIEGATSYSIFSYRTSLTKDIETDLSALPTTLIPLPANAGESLEIVSANAADTQDITLRVLGADGVLLDPVTVTLNGTTPVPIPGAISRINSAINVGLTAYVGNISIQQAGGGTIFAVMLPDDQKLSQGSFSIPKGFTGLASDIMGTMQKAGGASTSVVSSVSIKSFESTNAWVRIFAFGLLSDGDSGPNYPSRIPERVVGPADFKLSATASTTGTGVAARVGGVFFKTGETT